MCCCLISFVDFRGEIEVFVAEQSLTGKDILRYGGNRFIV